MLIFIQQVVVGGYIYILMKFAVLDLFLQAEYNGDI
jgi:hypothetical protein